MQAPRFSGIIRVTHSREEVERATKIGVERLRDGYSTEALVLAIDEVLDNPQLSRAIAVYVEAGSPEGDAKGSEVQSSWLSMIGALFFVGICLWLIVVLFRQVGPDTSIWSVLLIVIGQALLLRLAKGGVRHAVTSAGDSLNDASYPTNIHPMHSSSSVVGMLRQRRLRALVNETADRILAGERPADLVSDLSQVNLTPRAASLVVGLSRLNATLRDYLPPYEPRWLALTLAAVFVVTCVGFVERMGDQLAEGYQNYAIAVTAWLAGDIAARPRRKRSPTV